MEKWRGKVAIVTGANSGIGAAIATALVREGVNVVGLDRQEDQIKCLSNELSKIGVSGKLYSVKTDVRKEEEVLAAFAWVEEELGGADILVNNAGVARKSYVADGKSEEWREMLEVNFLAFAICCKEYLKSIEKRNIKAGHIINIASILAHETIPGWAIYTATKHAVKAFSMCLRKELNEKGTNIKVTTVCPGPVKTYLFDVANDETYHIPTMKPEDIARVIVDALSASSVTQICDIVVNTMPSPFLTY